MYSFSVSKKWAVLVVSLFSCVFFNPIYSQTDVSQQVVRGVVMKTDLENLNSREFFNQLKNRWGIAIDTFSEQEKTIVFSVEGAMVMLTSQDYPVPMLEWAAPAGISWLWRTARSEVGKHRSQVVISIAGKHGQSLMLYQIFTKIAAAVIESSPSLGVFMPNQYLLLPHNFYIESARSMMEGELPLYLWVYFGMLEENGMSSCYTYGMSEFGLKEMEVVNTPRSVSIAHAILFDVAQQTLVTGKKLRSGDEISIQNEETVVCQLSKGALLDEVETVKIILK